MRPPLPGTARACEGLGALGGGHTDGHGEHEGTAAAGACEHMVEGSTRIEECTEVRVGLGYALGVGAWVIGFGPTTEQSVSAVVVPEGEEH